MFAALLCGGIGAMWQRPAHVQNVQLAKQKENSRAGRPRQLATANCPKHNQWTAVWMHAQLFPLPGQLQSGQEPCYGVMASTGTLQGFWCVIAQHHPLTDSLAPQLH